MVAHVCFGPIQKSFELQSIRISVSYDIPNLADDSCENKHADQVADYCKNIPITKKKAKC